MDRGFVTPFIRWVRRLASPGSGRNRRTALRLLVRAHPGWAALVGALVVLTGALPAVFAVLVARLVESLPHAVGGGFDSPGGRAVIATLAGLGIVLVVQEGLSMSWIAWEDLLHRFDGHVRGRAMAATLSVPRLELFEDPELAATTDRVRFADRSPGEVVPGFAEKWSAQAPGLAATVLVATVWPVAALGLGALWFIVGRQLRADSSDTRDSRSRPFRRAQYLKQLAMMPAWAKEVRIFGLVDWLADRFGRQWGIYMEQLWQARRTGQRFIGLLFATIVVTNGVVLLLAVRSALDGALGTGALTLLVQGLFGMPALANQDHDHLIESGSIQIPEVLTLERTVKQLPVVIGREPGTGRPRREITFENVRFAYPGRDSTIFDGLDLRIEAGQSLGIVGLNGAGKTTLIKTPGRLGTPPVRADFRRRGGPC